MERKGKEMGGKKGVRGRKRRRGKGKGGERKGEERRKILGSCILLPFFIGI